MKLQSDNSPLRVQVFKAIEDAVLNGEYKDGDSLNELKISEELGVSRTPVREALMQLELEGLAKNIPNKGAVVIGITEKDIEDIYAVRIRIEGLAARLCAEKISEDELKRFQEIVDLQEFYLSKHDAEQIWSLDSEFHKIIYNASQSRPLKFMLSNFHNYIKRARDISVHADGRAEKTVSEHKAILQAVKDRDGELAELLMARHITNAKNNLIKQIQSEKRE